MRHVPVAVQEIKRRETRRVKEMGNKGSSVVEMSLIMPIIFGIVVMVIVLFWIPLGMVWYNRRDTV